jgi:hypothetical protein
MLVSDTNDSSILKKVTVSSIQAGVESFELVDDTAPELGGTLQFGANEATGLGNRRLIDQSVGSVVFGYNTEFPGYTLGLGANYGTTLVGSWAISDLYLSHLMDDYGTLGIPDKRFKNIHTYKITLGGDERDTWPTVNISNLPYHTTDWDGETTVAPSKNAIRDKIESLPGGHDSVTLATSATDIGLVISGSQELSYNNLAGIKVDVTGYIGIGTMTPSTKLDVIGTVTATVFNSTSSRKLKKNIKTFKKNALKIVNSISVKEFNFKRDKKKLYRVGFIADDTDIILAGKDKNIFDVNNTVGVLLKAVQELSKKITKIERGERK